MYYVKRGAAVIAVLLAAFLLWLFLTPMPTGIPILEYHMVTESTDADSDSWAYNVPPEEFSQQLDYLQQQGYTTITMLEYMKAKKGKLELPDKPIILTFDDGYEDNYTTMLPILEAHDMKATAYVITNQIGKPGYMGWNELRDMQERGVEIGCHTADHLLLPDLDEETQWKEVHYSKLLLEWNGIHTIFSFSYPNGAYNSELPAMLKDEEYLTAVTGDAGLNTFATDPYLMQRINIPHPRFGLTEFKLRLLKGAIMTKLGIRQHLEK